MLRSTVAAAVVGTAAAFAPAGLPTVGRAATREFPDALPAAPTPPRSQRRPHELEL
jgi:hypothetical protein